MTTPTPKKRTDVELWDALEKMADDDELERVMNMTDAEVAEEIRANGGDPDAIGQRGQALANRLMREQWQKAAKAKLEAARAVLDKPGPRKARGLSRDDLLKRIEIARSDPRLGGSIAVAFHKRTLDESSDAELEAMLDSIEDLVRLEDSLGRKK
jgi:hypothetical protein